MAQFIGRIRGNRGAETRLGSKQSGIRASADGWNIGAEVVAEHVDGRDVIRVYRTAGSNARHGSTLIAEFDATTPNGAESERPDSGKGSGTAIHESLEAMTAASR